MPQKYKYFLAVLFLISLNFGVCFARELEVPLPGLSKNASLIDYRNFIFMFLIGLGSSLAVLSLVLGAIRYLTSAGNPEIMRSAKSRMAGSILGLVLLLSSWIIIQMINPNLTTIGIVSLEGYGVFLSNGSTDFPAPVSVADTSTLTQGFNQIKYKCGPDGGPTLWLRKFTEKNLGDWADHTVQEINCGANGTINTPSFMLEFESPGIYLYSQNDCSASAPRSVQYLSSQSQMDENYIKKTKAFKSIPAASSKLGGSLSRYGALFHSGIGFKGKCSDISQNLGSVDICIPINLDDASSFTVFNVNDMWQTSGDGVTFYSKPFGWTVGAKAGYINLLSATIGISRSITNLEEDLKFDYTGIGVSQEEKDLCENFKKCPGSIRIKGDYLAVLYATDGSCEVFQADVPNLNISWVLNPEGGRTLDKVVIVAIR